MNRNARCISGSARPDACVTAGGGLLCGRAGDCELIEQLQKQILPLFPARNVDLTANCIPRQASPGSTRLKAEVLKAAAQSNGS